MKDAFNDILGMDGVKGILLLSFEGNVLYHQFRAGEKVNPAKVDWKPIVSTLEGTREADLIFHQGRVYIRRTAIGYLVIPMSNTASIAMLRLNCDILLPSLKSAKGASSIKRLFKK